MIIYKIQNKIDNKIYVGQTKYDITSRIKDHIFSRSHIGNALRKYGLQSFDISVIDSANDRKVLSCKEIYWISFYDCKYPNGYNHTSGGDGLFEPSQDIRDRISQKMKEIGSVSEFTFKDHHHKEESKQQISNSLKITMALPEVKAKLGSGRRNKTNSKEHNDKIGKSNKGKLKGRVPWNAGLKMKEYDPNYVNPGQGKQRPDLSEKNRQSKGRKVAEENKSNILIAQQVRRKREKELSTKKGEELS